jgi:hypothetical protein
MTTITCFDPQGAARDIVSAGFLLAGMRVSR